MHVLSRVGLIILHASVFIVMPQHDLKIFSVAEAQDSSGEQLQTKIVTGILKELNLEEKRGTIVTDLGDPVFFALSDPGMMADISQGQHVTAGINQEGVLTKIIETPVPELKEPLP